MHDASLSCTYRWLLVAISALITAACGSDTSQTDESNAPPTAEECEVVQTKSCFLRQVERAKSCLAGFSGRFNATQEQCVAGSGAEERIATFEPKASDGLPETITIKTSGGKLCLRVSEAGNTQRFETEAGVVTLNGDGANLEITCDDGSSERISARALMECPGASDFPSWTESSSSGNLSFGFGFSSSASCRPE